jgi:alkylated DNA repair dioxygenase AlkB
MIKTLIKTDNSFLTVQTYSSIELLEDCVKDVESKLLVKPKIYIYGKEATQHRNIGFFSDESIGYRYSNQLAKSQALTPVLKKLLDEVNELYDADFNGILINKYVDGNDYIGKHSDDEKNLSNIGVVSLSYGSTRKFRVRDKKTNKIVKDVLIKHNQIMHMGGNFQKEFTHEIPIEKKITTPRYSFTFRKHKE